MPSASPPHPLASRLAALRRRLRVVATVRGVSLLVGAVVLIAVAGGALDWWLHLPGLVRALLLTGLLASAGTIVYVHLFQPLRQPADDLALALRVEEAYPELNDCLASTVQFLQQPDAPDPAGSNPMRQAAVRQALQKAGACDFNRIVNSRGLRVAGIGMVAAAALGVGLVAWQPGAAKTALVRLAHPFGGTEWPPATLLELEPALRTRIARGEPFELRASLKGVVPERAVVRFWFDGSAPADHSYAVQRTATGEVGSFLARLEPLRVQKNFRFQVQANDALTPWLAVSVLPPVALVPLDGRPSPQIRLRYPSYTDLPALDLPAGAGTIEGVLGTHIALRAATDRALARAWIEYHPDQPTLKLSTLLGMLGARHAGEAITVAAGGQPVWGRVPVEVKPHGSGSVLRAAFVPWVSGTYALRLIDTSNLASSRLFDIRVFPDPPPLVTLERPSASHDMLAMLPGATVTLRAVSDDPQFAVRSVWLAYRTSRDDPARAQPLWDHARAGAALPTLLPAVLPAPLVLPLLPVRVRPGQVAVERRLALASIRHEDGRPLREGDVVILQVAADDFDDVTAGKQPGRSHEVELRIVAPAALEAQLHQAQEQVQQELQRLREQEREAVKKVAAVEKQWRATGKLRLEDLDNLLQAEQQQQQIRGRIGTKEEGLRAEVDRIRQALRDNNLPRSGTHERMELLAQELDRVAREELEQIEPLLTEARKENEVAREKPQPDRKKGNLAAALEHQKEVERTIGDLLTSLDPFSTKRQARAEARALLQEQQKLAEQVDRLKQEVPQGRAPQKADQQAELERAAEAQGRLAEHLGQLLNKMDRVAAEKRRLAEDKAVEAENKLHLQQLREAQAEQARAAGQPERAQQLAEEARNLRRDAEALQDAAEAMRQEARDLAKASSAGRGNDAEGQMKQAGQNIQGNKLFDARAKQQKSADALQEMAKALDERRAEDLDRLVKNLKEARKELERLTEEQDRLQKKVKEAQKIADPKEREEELQRLARAQEKVRQQAREMAQQLSRMRANRAGQALREAGAEMDQAAQMLERGDKEAEEAGEDALERLQDALDDLDDAKEQAEEELAREKLQKIAEQLKLLKERQEAQVPETERIHRQVLQQKAWERAVLISLKRQAEAQKAVGDDAAALAKDKLKDAEVFAHLLEKAGKAMAQAAETMKERVAKGVDRGDVPLDAKAEEAAYQKTVKLQRDALAQLDALLEALKPDEGAAGRGARGGERGAASGGRESDGIPELAQLKLLKALQLDVNKRTEEFARANPDAKKLTPEQEKELAGLREDQADISRLLDGLTAPAKPEGDKP